MKFCHEFSDVDYLSFSPENCLLFHGLLEFSPPEEHVIKDNPKQYMVVGGEIPEVKEGYNREYFFDVVYQKQ